MTTTPTPAFTLTAPEVISPVQPPQAVEAVPLKPEVASQVDDQVRRFIDALEKEDLRSEPFKARLDSAFQLGRQEISLAASLMQGRLLQRNFVGAADTPAYQAISAIRTQLDELNPGKDGDLLQPRKLLGLIPFGNKLEAYFRRYESAASQLQKSMNQLYAAKDDIQKDLIDIEATRGKLWDAMQSLGAAARFARTLDSRLAERVEALKATDPLKAKALEQEVLFYARQNLADIQTQQAVCVNGYLALDVLKKTGREMMIGCDRVATTGMSALAVAQTVARASTAQWARIPRPQAAPVATRLSPSKAVTPAPCRESSVNLTQAPPPSRSSKPAPAPGLSPPTTPTLAAPPSPQASLASTPPTPSAPLGTSPSPAAPCSSPPAAREPTTALASKTAPPP